MRKQLFEDDKTIICVYRFEVTRVEMIIGVISKR